jgi:hypothetical protein
MGTWKLRGRGAGVRGAVVLGAAALGIAAMASACAHGASALAMAAATGAPAGTATPDMTPTPVPELGAMRLGTFPATADGTRALMLCEQWAGLRGQYVARVLADSRPELEQWFSGDDWLPAFSDASALRNDPGYMTINVGFGLVSTAQSASVGNARFLDKSCAAAD